MSTRDPFLIAVGVFVDRLISFSVLSVMHFCLLWDFIFERCLEQSSISTMEYLKSIFRGTATSVVQVLFWLIAAQALCIATALALWLFRRWRRGGRMGAGQLRGTPVEEV